MNTGNNFSGIKCASSFVSQASSIPFQLLGNRSMAVKQVSPGIGPGIRILHGQVHIWSIYWVRDFQLLWL